MLLVEVVLPPPPSSYETSLPLDSAKGYLNFTMLSSKDHDKEHA